MLDTNLSLAKVDQGLAHETREMMALTGLALLAVVVLSGLFVWSSFTTRLRELQTGTDRIAERRTRLSDPGSVAVTKSASWRNLSTQ